MKWLDIVNKSKSPRFLCRYYASRLKPDWICRLSLRRILASIDRYDANVIDTRVRYYNKLTDPFLLDAPVTMRSFHHDGNTAMQMDFKSVMRYFERSECFQFRFGDTKRSSDIPSFVKSRPIGEHNQNSVLLKLNSARHFNFVDDPAPFEKKKNIAVWRGAVCQRPLRIKLMDEYFGHPRCDLGDTDKKKQDGPKSKPILLFSEQLQHKFIISVEGNDVATSTKWIMSSNSLCFMTRPKHETWFMEGRLKPDVHYVLLNDDFSDLEEKIDFYTKNTEAALEIIRNAHQYIAGFKDQRFERLISLLVIKKYFDLCGN